MDDYYWFDASGVPAGGVGGVADDGELRCALDSFCCVSPPAAVGFRSEEGAYGDGGGGDGSGSKQTCSRKRARDESCSGVKSKACREKIRRDKLNERFLELSSVLDPGRPPKSDKASILGDAARALVELRNEAEKLKESNERLQEKIKALKAEKNEIRDEKMKLKAEKERLEQQVNAMTATPASYMPHPFAFHPMAPPAAFAPLNHSPATKASPYPAYPPMGMCYLLPSAVRDTTQDPKLWPPSA